MIWFPAFRFVAGLKSQLPGFKKLVGFGKELVYHIRKQLVLFIFYPVEVAMVLIGGEKTTQDEIKFKNISGFVLLEVKFN